MASYEQGKNKLWSVRFRTVEFGEYKQKRLSGFKTKKEAEKGYADFLSTHFSAKKSDYSKITVNQLYQKYLLYIENRLKVSTIYDIKNIYNKYIYKYFGEYRIFKITKIDILNWQQTLNDKNLSYKYKVKIRGFFSNILKYAVNYFDLPVNPFTQVENFKRTTQKTEMQIWSKEEFLQFINYVDNFKLKIFFMFLYTTGVRKGEAFALTWNKIDFKNKKITINCNLTRKVENKYYEIIPTKTYENRTLLMPDSLVELLKILKSQDTANNFVFGGDSPLSENTVSRNFKKYIEISKVKNIHLHCLRHSHASYLISQGNSIVMVSKRLGHSTIEQTLNTYSHLMPNDEEKLIKCLNFI